MCNETLCTKKGNYKNQNYIKTKTVSKAGKD